ncbi:MAG: DUF177 domain-containing protein [Alistipes sp.]|nr:DUF177 domain-containing protein [Alistipes sp.]
MELNNRYSIAYKGLKNSTHDFHFEVDDELFAAYESREIKGGKLAVELTMLKADNQLEMDFAISGEVTCECDRCLEDCAVPIDYEGHLIVRISNEEGEYDGDIMWISPADDTVDLTQYIYESIVLSLPYQRVHPEGECNPEMIARFAVATDEEIEAIEARAQQSEKRGIGEGDFNKLAALKAQLESEERGE